MIKIVYKKRFSTTHIVVFIFFLSFPINKRWLLRYKMYNNDDDHFPLLRYKGVVNQTNSLQKARFCLLFVNLLMFLHVVLSQDNWEQSSFDFFPVTTHIVCCVHVFTWQINNNNKRKKRNHLCQIFVPSIFLKRSFASLRDIRQYLLKWYRGSMLLWIFCVKKHVQQNFGIIGKSSSN